MSEQILLRMPTCSAFWMEVRDGDPLAFELFKRHYSHREYKDGRRNNPAYRNRHQFVGPGEKMVLVDAGGQALFVWRKFIDASGQHGVNCAVFRSECSALASMLIIEAEKVALKRWPNARFYTYVNPKKIQHKRQPGRCFLKAGWRYCGETKKGLLVLEKFTTAASYSAVNNF